MLYKNLILFLIFFTNLYPINIKKDYQEKYMQDLHLWLPNTFVELKSLDEEKLYKMAKEEYHYHIDKTNFYSVKELLEIEKMVDEIKLNQYFVDILNKERKKLGLSANIKVSLSLVKAAKVRSQELTLQSKLSHKRPDGKDFWTAIEEADSSLSEKTSFENALNTSLANEAQMVSEKFIAEHFFELWKSSPLHWKAMIDPNITNIGINFSLGFSSDKNFLSQMNYGIMLGYK